MSAQTAPSQVGGEIRVTANDRFKRSFATWFWTSMILATVAHFVLFAAWPEMTAMFITPCSSWFRP